MITEHYSIELVCDVDFDHPYNGPFGRQKSKAHFVGEGFSDCIAQARAKGWRGTPGMRCVCPDCVIEGRSLK